MQANKQTCPKCQLPVAPAERIGSFTSFVFMDLHCQCHKGAKPELNAGKAKAVSNSCKTCGKVIPSINRPGSITSFLLRDLRCTCPKSKKGPDDVLRTRYVPARATLTRKRQLLETAMRTRQANLTASDARLIDLKPGELIGGCYKLDYLVGKGGMGLIYRAKHQSLDRTVALKFIAPSLVSKENWNLFKNEAKISSTLSHSTICQIYDLGLHAGVLPFYAMDFIEGQTLEEIILNSGPLSVGATLEIFSKAAEGLSYAHRRSVVHKDIKPANIMVTNTAQGLQVKILDFGIAELNEGRKDKKEIEVIYGSAAYMSPEQFRGQPLDLRTDLYSMGCAMYETLTGMPPFQDATYEALCESHKRAEVPLLSDSTGIEFAVELEAIIQKCLQKQAEKRYQSANELAIDLQRLMDGKELQFARNQIADIRTSVHGDLAAPAHKQPVIFIWVAASILLASAASLIYLQVANLDRTSSDLKDPEQKVSAEAVAPKRSEAHIQSDTSISKSTYNLEDTFVDMQTGQNALNNEFFVKEDTGPDNTKRLIYKFPPSFNSAEIIHSSSDFDRFSIDQLDSPVISHQRSFSQSNTKQLCVGKIEVPGNKFLTLKFLPGTAISPDFVKGFRQKDIRGLDFSMYADDTQSLNQSCVNRFVNLERLILSNTQENDQTIKSLSSFKHLKQLALIDWYCSKNTVPYISLFPELTTLYVSTKGSPEALLRFYLASCPLQNIILRSTILSQSDIDYLTNLKTLKSVSFGGCKFPKGYLKELFNSKSITQVNIWSDYFNPYEQDLQAISASSALKEIHFYSLKAPTVAAQRMIDELKKRSIKCTWEITKTSSKGFTAMPATNSLDQLSPN
ncbi:MAG: serine/threonine protein kinase [Candidatus Obscuribacter sp.]|nr:serine/threonine protein kinase [Candidatus Obscuribacter sp.]